MSQYLTKFIAIGERDESILTLGFDLDQWNARRKKKEEQITPEEKSELIPKIIHRIHRNIDKYYGMDLTTLFQTNRSHFFELKGHLEALVKNNEITDQQRTILKQMKHKLLIQARLHDFNDFSYPSQNEIIRWIFRNEDKVWRDRGGRPEETLSTFLDFIEPKQQGILPSRRE
jgi:hypothetical protein